MAFNIVFCQDLPEPFKQKGYVYNHKHLKYEPIDKKFSCKFRISGNAQNFYSN